MTPAQSLVDLIGNTPMVKLSAELTGSPANLFCKLEYLNPSGSIKDRMARYIILAEQKRGTIKRGDTICDNTSGNTGISLAMVTSVTGYRTVVTTPEKTSQEKIDLIRSFGGEVVVTPNVPTADPRHCYHAAKTLAAEKGYYWLNQYDTPLNPEAHYADTGPEIWAQTKGKITHFVMGIGSGGTISGVGKYLKEQNPGIRVIGVDIEGSMFREITSGEPLPEPKPYLVEGLGTDRPVGAYEAEYIDEVLVFSDLDSFLAARQLGRTAGLSVGGSTGAIFLGARQVCAGLDASACVVFPGCDSGIRYVTKFLSDDWMVRHGFGSAEGTIKQKLEGIRS